VVARAPKESRAAPPARTADARPQAAANVSGPGAEEERPPASVAPDAPRAPAAPLAHVEIVRTAPVQHASYFGVAARAGIAVLQTRFTSNGSSPALAPNYQYSTTALTAEAALGFGHTFGRHFYLGIDGRYVYAGAAGVRLPQPSGTFAQLAVRTQDFAAELSPGLHFDAAGGLNLTARVGVEAVLEEVGLTAAAAAYDPHFLLPKNLYLGMTAGLGIALPQVAHIGRRPLGLYAFGSVLAPATLAQSPGFADGRRSSTIGWSAGGGLVYGLLADTRRGQLSLEARYDYLTALTASSGACPQNVAATATAPRQGTCRDDSVTAANRASIQHLVAGGLVYSY
jgi:hypothetical protein